MAKSIEYGMAVAATWVDLAAASFGAFFSQFNSVWGYLGTAVVLAVWLIPKWVPFKNIEEALPRKWALILLSIWFGWVFMTTTHNRLVSVPVATNAPPPAYPVENSDHERRLKELERLEGVDRENQKLKEANEVLEGEKKQLQNRLDDRARRSKARFEIGRLMESGKSLRTEIASSRSVPTDKFRKWFTDSENMLRNLFDESYVVRWNNEAGISLGPLRWDTLPPPEVLSAITRIDIRLARFDEFQKEMGR